ncbi:GntR family transcriptional regulator [Leekyejoonella antrihumi]|uniref:GntR family transcriptional regulator n=1 Tax=Leekyejoonella antrihumi TaxID=1660198 RepID=A0A563DY96_9MICO|nr:GntR family transcriptional regulator [Leekyejoonella antrihumi]TWP34942.1 GntR family transcriptional regulator [Leekyejoonella antrihumi]
MSPHSPTGSNGSKTDGMREPRAGESRYRVLTQLLRERIFRGEFENRALPTEISLAGDYGLSRQTVRRAYQELVSEGLVYRIRGSGTYVRPRETRYNRSFGSVDDLLQLQLDTTFELTEPMHRVTDAEIASRLRQDFAELWALIFRRRHQDKAFCLTRVYLPLRIGAALAEVPELNDPALVTGITVISLIQSHGFDIAEAEQVITATAAGVDESRLLSVPTASPLLHVERNYLDRQGRALELAVSDFLPDEYQHRTQLGRQLAPMDFTSDHAWRKDSGSPSQH